jgi:gamma-glutamylcyclotransferase (GGCT)/AIG2-like uncharacterized protein YtfP
MGERQTVRLFVNGQGMSGGALNGPLQSQTFLGAASTAPRYRFFSVRDEFPALLPAGGGPQVEGARVEGAQAEGAQVEGELYEVDLAVLRDVFLPREPAELELAIIEMADGSGAFAVRLRPGLEGMPGLTEITQLGSWRRYVDSLG